MASDVKWIKIVTDIFDDEKILLIESMPEADCIIVIWFKLLCLAGKQNNNGVFMLNDRIPYNDEMLAHIFRRPLNIVRIALKAFEQYGMIEIINNTITIPNWSKHQQLDSLNKRREYQKNLMAKRRAEQKRLAKEAPKPEVLALTPANTLAPVSGPDIEIERDIDNKNTSYSCPEDIENVSAQPPKEPAVFRIMLNDRSFHSITQADIDKYRTLYPAVDVEQEIRNMIGWTESNPTKRKTRSGIKAFITKWLIRSQNNGSKPQSSSPQEQPQSTKSKHYNDLGVW